MSGHCGTILAVGQTISVVGGAVIAILAGMVVTMFIRDKSRLESGIKFTSKKFFSGP